jgi:outer membrane protein TolC
MIHQSHWWTAWATLCVVGCTTTGGKLMSRTSAPAGGAASAMMASKPPSTTSATAARPTAWPASPPHAKTTADSVAVADRGVTLVAAEEPVVDRAPTITPESAPPEIPSAETESTGTATIGNEPGLPPVPDGGDAASASSMKTPAATPGSPLQLQQVIGSITQSYPLLEIAIYGRNIAAGEQLMAEGNFDLKLKGTSDNTPVGFYRTHRQSLGLEQQLYNGASVFGGYKVGRGEFEPWYLERQTNDGGEFRAGMTIPLAQNRAIDERRAELWKATYGRNAVEPAIQAQMISFIYDGSLAYWDWVAAGLNARYAQELYELAANRVDVLKQSVEAGAIAESSIPDNQRLIVSRQVKLIEARQKLQQTAVKLSLFLRDANGEPIIPTLDQLPTAFPSVLPVSDDQLPADIAEAMERRPELRELDFNRRIAEVDLAQAHNLSQPEIDATLWGAQDVGGLTSSTGDKQPFELQGSLNVSVPLQRRKAAGKVWATEGKIAQINIKREFAADKIETQVRNATIALVTAYQSLNQARESVLLNEEMERYEDLLLLNGTSDILRVNIREQQTFDAKVIEINAQLRYFEAQAELRAALGLDADILAMP